MNKKTTAKNYRLNKILHKKPKILETGKCVSPFFDRLVYDKKGRIQEKIESLFMPELEFTQREIEVLKLLANGDNNKEIGKKLFVSVHTVKVHIHNIFVKLSSTRRTEAVVKAIKANIIKI